MTCQKCSSSKVTHSLCIVMSSEGQHQVIQWQDLQRPSSAACAWSTPACPGLLKTPKACDQSCLAFLQASTCCTVSGQGKTIAIIESVTRLICWGCRFPVAFPASCKQKRQEVSKLMCHGDILSKWVLQNLAEGISCHACILLVADAGED